MTWLVRFLSSLNIFKRESPQYLTRRTPLAMAFVMVIGIIALGLVIDLERTSRHQAELRESAEHSLADLVQKIDGHLRRDLMIADNLANVLRYKSRFSPVQLDDEARSALQMNRHIRAIAVAPDNKLSHILTRDGTIDLSSNQPRPDQQNLHLKILARQLSGLSPTQEPILLPDPDQDVLNLAVPVPGADEQSWGSLVLLIDRNAFLSDVGLDAPSSSVSLQHTESTHSLHVSIEHRGLNGTSPITGKPHAADILALSGQLDLFGTGQWHIRAIPQAGWDAAPEDLVPFRIFLTLTGLAVIVPIIIAAFLIGERNRNIQMLKAREANLLELSQRFNLAMETSNIGIWEVKADNHLIWDERAATLHGKTPDMEANRLEEWLDLIVPDDLAAAEAHFFTAICSSEPCTNIYRIRTAQGEIRYLRSAGASYRKSDLTTHTTGIVWDVTSDMMVNKTLLEAKADSDIKNAELELALDELSNREQELEELSTRLNLALASYNCGIWESIPYGGAEIWDERMCQLYGIPEAGRTVDHGTWISMIHPEDRFMARGLVREGPNDLSAKPLTVRVPQPDGSIRYVRSIGKMHPMRDGSTKLVGIAFDVTGDMLMTQQLQAAKREAEAKNVELELAKHRIEHNALHDPLTGLANRRKLDIELDALTQQSRAQRMQVSILHLDLDRFKQINDTLGHAAGDAMLVYAAQILTRNVSGKDVVARIGGDEFVILIQGESDADAVAELSNRIITEIRQPLDFEGFSCRCGVSIGIAQASGTRIDGRKMLVNADIALYRAKNLGRNRYEFFTQNLQSEIITQKRTADELLTAIEEQQFVTWYQPQFCANSMKLTGVEALVRWRHPHRGILAPDAFLGIAEDLNVTATLDQIVLETVLKDQMRWAAAGIDVPKVSVNVSSKRLKDEGLIETLKTLQITPGRISFELIESIFLDESEDGVTANLDRIKALGIDIEIDDFGTGHTSIVSLLKLRPKRLKIDRQLVMPILESRQELTLVRAIIDIAKSLGVETVAEGVETMQHAKVLRDMGCDLLQGYAFSRPLPYENFSTMAMAGFRQAS
jgi:diguanylate cyclase (GGDEF)-like protein